MVEAPAAGAAVAAAVAVVVAAVVVVVAEAAEVVPAVAAESHIHTQRSHSPEVIIDLGTTARGDTIRITQPIRILVEAKGSEYPRLQW